jgi:hypothetical protein
MKILVLVFIGMTPAFLAESCQGDRTQGQQSVPKTAKSTVEVLRQAGRCGLLCVTPCACARATAEKLGTYSAMYKYYHNNFSANKQNRDVQTREQGGSSV